MMHVTNDRDPRDPIEQSRRCQREGWDQFGLCVWPFRSAEEEDDLTIRTVLYLPDIPEQFDYLKVLWREGSYDCPDIEGARVEYFKAIDGRWVKQESDDSE
jgi:hypothetical protein